jgi:hypothetical protein
MGAANMTRPGADLIAWYLSPDRLPVAERWPRKHADTQRRLCQRFAAPVIGAVTCQGITIGHMQKIVSAGPTAGEGDRLHRMLSAMVGAGIKGGYLVNPMLAEVQQGSVVVHVHNVGGRIDRLRHLVHVADVRQAGANVEELVDGRLRRQESGENRVMVDPPGLCFRTESRLIPRTPRSTRETQLSD